MEKSLLKLKCRYCQSIISLTKDNQEKDCDCGKCTLGMRNGKVYVGSSTGLGDYILIDGDEEYITLPKSEMEGDNG